MLRQHGDRHSQGLNHALDMYCTRCASPLKLHTREMRSDVSAASLLRQRTTLQRQTVKKAELAAIVQSFIDYKVADCNLYERGRAAGLSVVDNSVTTSRNVWVVRYKHYKSVNLYNVRDPRSSVLTLMVFSHDFSNFSRKDSMSASNLGP